MIRTLIFTTVVGIFHMCFGQDQFCPLGPYHLTRFGPSCEYLCHCSGNQCNRNTGACFYGNECDAGWMGNGCQYSNSAYNAVVRCNDILDVQKIVDGRKSTCTSPTSKNKDITLTIDFEREVNITEVHLFFISEAPPFNISVLGTIGSSLCDSVRNTSGQREFLVKCRIPLYGQSIDIIFNGPVAALAFCELQALADQACSLGPQNLTRFGSLCEYLCHCGGYQCDRNTGECLSDNECDAGWMGSGCQYADIAYSAEVKTNYMMDVPQIVDGNKSTCAFLTSGNKVTALTIDFKREVKITEVHILFSKEGDCKDGSYPCLNRWCSSPWFIENCPRSCHFCAPPFNISVLGTSGTSMCGSVTNTSGQMEFLVKCGIPLYGQCIVVTIYEPSEGLALCELQVPAGRDLAISKPAEQSSLFEKWSASLAVDGVTSRDTSSETCTHTLESNDTWWLLDLQAPILIQWFRIYNRKDDQRDQHLNKRLKFFRILLSQDNKTYNEYYQDNSTDPPMVINASRNSDFVARYVKIDLQGENRTLTLCEVQVFGDCNDGHYGDCSKTCDNCLEETCDMLTGYCPECKPGYFGNNCNKSCANCRYCHKYTGICRSCPPGKVGDACQFDCNNFSYGDNCTARCGNCLEGDICLKTTGNCPRGCHNGWRGEQCLEACDYMHYGQNCAHECGHCLNVTCDRITGNCSGFTICQPGWEGPRCEKSSKNMQTSENPDIDAGVIGGSAGAGIAVIGIVALVIIFVIKRRRKNSNSLSKLQGTRNISRKKDDGSIYENSTFVDTNDSILPVEELNNETQEYKHTTVPRHEKTVAKIKKEDAEVYYNMGHALPAGTVPLSKFWDYVQDTFMDENFFSKEFEKLPSGPQLPTNVALRPENRNKNRYKQFYAYDVNRVILKPLGDDENDYINASFVDGYSHQKVYIASQGATKENINDFWRMLWQYDVEKTVMLTGLLEGGKHKCELYWPEEEGQTRMFGSVAVRLLDTDAFADYDIRILEMSVGRKSKQLTQFHYTAWPDKGVPKAASSVVQFWNSVNKVPTKKPIVVHCSAGIGRTGTYIALDYLANQGKAEGHVNVSACVSNLRRERVNLVQTKEQYIFLHEALVEALMLSGTATTSQNFPKVYKEMLETDVESRKLKLQLEYQRLQNEVINHEAVYATVKMEDEEGGEIDSKQDEFSAAKKPENRTKNRHDNIVPADRDRVFLHTPVLGRNDYINAVVLPGHKQRKGFILTQMPLTDTVVDFWRMIHDFEVKTIIMFNSEISKAHDIGIYWPKDGVVRYGPFSVRLTKQETCKNYIERILSFSLTGDAYDRSVKQFQFKTWADNSGVHGSTESFLQLIDAVESWQKETEAKPVIVHCLNGAQRSGLYCVISTVIERLKVERDVAIAQTIKRMQAIRQQIIPNYEQFRFCHECMLQYIKTFETYSNF